VIYGEIKINRNKVLRNHIFYRFNLSSTLRKNYKPQNFNIELKSTKYSFFNFLKSLDNNFSKTL